MYKVTGDSARMKKAFYAKGGENGSSPGTSVNPELMTNYVGIPFGASSSAYTAGNISPIGPAQLVKGVVNKPFILFTAAESNFLLAGSKRKIRRSCKSYRNSTRILRSWCKGILSPGGASAAAATTYLSNGGDLTDWTCFS
jgi:hypothetical protein